MSERRPAQPDPRASLVDSGWSEPAPAEERTLPSYEDSGREHLITRVDDEIQARIAAMNLDERGDVTVTGGRALPSPPPPLPPPLPELSAAPTDERTLVDSPLPSSPVASPRPVGPAPSRPNAAAPSHPFHAAPSRPNAAAPSHPFHAAPSRPNATTPSHAFTAVAPSRPTKSAPPPRAAALPPPSLPPPPPSSLLPPSLPPPPRPSFSPMHATDAAFVPPPKLGEALLDRVRVGGAELPLWGLLLPAFLVTVLVTAFIAGAAASGSKEGHAVAAPAATAESAQTGSATQNSPAPSQAESNPPSGSGSLADRARSGDEKALGVIEHQRPQDRSTDEALALANGKLAQALSTIGKLRARLASDPGLAKDPKVIADLRRMAQEPDTSRDALAAMAALPGSLSADLLYEAWTSTAERSTTTELAQALLMGRDVRPKASPALAVALDLRDAESCEDNAKLLQRAIDVGDKRAFAPLSRLLRRNGCGATKRDDCYPCIREGDQLKLALNAVKMRREPELVRRDTR